jgi:uncharacterized protein DUF222
MSSQAPSDREAVMATLDRWDAVQAELAELSFAALTPTEVLDIKGRLECGYRRQAAVDHRLTRELTSQASPIDLGGKSWGDVLSTRLRISKNEARQRLQEAEDLAPRTTLSGEPLVPRLPHTAAAQARGDIGAEHVRIIRKFFADLPTHIDYQSRALAEADLARIAAGFTPEALRKAADRLTALLDPDGAEPDDTERARKRSFRIGPQQADGMSPASLLLDPQARATLDAVLAKWAAPGMCNPADQAPCVDGTPSQDHIDNDHRTQDQRNHDALTAIGRAMLASGQLGQHNGLPVTIIVSTTLQDLESGTGHAVTAGGTLLPMSDVIRLAAHAHHYLVVFDKHTGQTLYLGRSKRIASPGQRIVLHAKDRGCTRPGCTVPGYGCQAHHAELDWGKGGLTNIDDLTFACGPDNRLVTEHGWKTRKRRDGRTEWIPPPPLDTGQTRVNNYHHPEKYLLPEDDDTTATQDDDPTAA